METIIIIPCYNESKRLPTESFLDFADKNPQITFLFVNDGSTDDTLSVLEDLATKNPSLQYLNLDKNGGKAEAIRQGMLYVVNQLESDYIGFLDADLATPLDEMPCFIELSKRKDYEMITGLRLARLGTEIKRKTVRHYLGRIFATCASLMLKLPVYDTQCGAKLYKTEIVFNIFKSPFITRWLFDVELLARYISFYGREKATTKIYEYPILKWEDVQGSRLKVKDFIRAPYELLIIKRKYLKNK